MPSASAAAASPPGRQAAAARSQRASRHAERRPAEGLVRAGDEPAAGDQRAHGAGDRAQLDALLGELRGRSGAPAAVRSTAPVVSGRPRSLSPSRTPLGQPAARAAASACALPGASRTPRAFTLGDFPAVMLARRDGASAGGGASTAGTAAAGSPARDPFSFAAASAHVPGPPPAAAASAGGAPFSFAGAHARAAGFPTADEAAALRLAPAGPPRPLQPAPPGAVAFAPPGAVAADLGGRWGSGEPAGVGAASESSRAVADSVAALLGRPQLAGELAVALHRHASGAALAAPRDPAHGLAPAHPQAHADAVLAAQRQVHAHGQARAQAEAAHAAAEAAHAHALAQAHAAAQAPRQQHPSQVAHDGHLQRVPQMAPLGGQHQLPAPNAQGLGHAGWPHAHQGWPPAPFGVAPGCAPPAQPPAPQRVHFGHPGWQPAGAGQAPVLAPPAPPPLLPWPHAGHAPQQLGAHAGHALLLRGAHPADDAQQQAAHAGAYHAPRPLHAAHAAGDLAIRIAGSDAASTADALLRLKLTGDPDLADLASSLVSHVASMRFDAAGANGASLANFTLGVGSADAVTAGVLIGASGEHRLTVVGRAGRRAPKSKGELVQAMELLCRAMECAHGTHAGQGFRALLAELLAHGVVGRMAPSGIAGVASIVDMQCRMFSAHCHGVATAHLQGRVCPPVPPGLFTLQSDLGKQQLWELLQRQFGGAAPLLRAADGAAHKSPFGMASDGKERCARHKLGQCQQGAACSRSHERWPASMAAFTPEAIKAILKNL